MNWLFIITLPLIFVGGWAVGRFFCRVVRRWMGRTGGELHVDCPSCWRRLSAVYRPVRLPSPLDPSAGIVGIHRVDELDLACRVGDLELTCRCGMKVIVLGLNIPVEDVSEGSSHG